MLHFLRIILPCLQYSIFLIARLGDIVRTGCLICIHYTFALKYYNGHKMQRIFFAFLHYIHRQVKIALIYITPTFISLEINKKQNGQKMKKHSQNRYLIKKVVLFLLKWLIRTFCLLAFKKKLLKLFSNTYVHLSRHFSSQKHKISPAGF